MLAAWSADPGAIDDRYLLSPWPEGSRCLVLLDDRIRLRARSGRDLAPSVPQIVEELEALRRTASPAILDGVLAWPPGVASDSPRLEAAETLHLLDALYVGGRSVTRLGLKSRLRALDAIGLGEGERVRVLPAWRGSASAALDQVRQAGRAAPAGLLARLADAPYRPGCRSREWLAFTERRTDELLVCGIASSGALVLGLPTSHGPAFAGLTWPTRHWGDVALRCREGAPAFSAPPLGKALGRVAWAEPEIWVAVERDERPDSGRGGPRWRFVRVLEDLSPAAAATCP